MSNPLAKYEALISSIERAKTIEEAIDGMAKADALKAYTRKIGMDLHGQNLFAEAKLRGERRAGQLLKGMDKAKPGPKKIGDSVSPNTTLADIGITNKQSSRWQQTASVPKPTFESYIAKSKASNEEITQAGVQRIRREIKEDKRHKKRQDNAEKVSNATSVKNLRGVFSTILIDPPWDWSDEGDVNQMGRAKPDYATMTQDQLSRFPVLKWAAIDCHLYCWVTNRSMPKVFGLMRDWGFRYVTLLTWPKPSFGLGNYFRGQTEHIAFGIKGSLMLKRKNASTLLPTWNRGTKHSSKPTEVYEFIESCSPGPYLEIFGRNVTRKAWSVIGEDSK